MRALRSRNVESDSGSNEQMEESESVIEESISKKSKRKKLKKHTSDTESTEHLLEELRAAEEYISKKNKRKKSRKHTSDSIEHMIEGSEHGTETEVTLTKKVKRKKSKKHTSDRESNKHIMENSEHGTETETTLSKKAKRKKSKKHTFVRESNEHMMEDSEHGTETEVNLTKKVKRKKSKKHTSDRESNEHMMENSEHGSETEATLTKKVNGKISKKHKSVRGSNEQVMEDSENRAETEGTPSKKIKRKKSKKHTSDENDPDSERVPEKKLYKKRKQLKRSITHSEDNSTALNQPTKTVLNISTESQQTTEKPIEEMVKKMSRKPREFLRSTIVNSPKFDNVITSTVMKPKQATDSPVEEMAKKMSRKPREFLRSTILNSPKFDGVVTSTVMKPKRLEIQSDGSEIDEEFMNKSPQKISKFKKSKSKQNSRRPSQTEDNKKDFDMVPKHKFLNETDDSILQLKTTISKRSTFTRSNAIDSIVTDKHLEHGSPNKSMKQESIPRRTTAENTINSTFESVSNHRKTFNKMPKVIISNGADSVIAISDSPEISKVTQNSFNKSNLIEAEITSDEEMITDDSLEQTSSNIEENKRMSEQNGKEAFNKLAKNKILLAAENTVITISDTPERTIIKQNTFNKSDTKPEITSDEDSEINDYEMKQIPNKINESTKCNTHDQSLNGTNIKDIQNNTTFSLRETFCKTPINISSPKSEKSFGKVNNLSEEKINKEFEGLSDVSESILDDVIDISDSPDKTKLKQSTFNLSSNSANNTINKTNSDIKSNDTFENKIVNTSGDWQVENSPIEKSNDFNKKLNDTFEVENKENNSQNSNSSKGNSTIVNESNNTMKNENMSLSPTDKNIRKKWLKFPRHSSDAQTVLDQISSPKLQKKMNASKIVQKMMSTPTNLFNIQKQSIAPSNYISVKNDSANKSPKNLKRSPLKLIKKSPLKSLLKSVVNGSSTKKSGTKRTAMPNFALIHKRAYEKLENLAEYSERKKQRAQMLLSSNKPNSKRKSLSKLHKEKTEETKSKSSRQLFANDMNDKYNRFGFKITDPTKKPTFLAKPDTNVAIVKPVIKSSVFARSEVVAIANKNKAITNNRDKKRDMLKGVRTNRRFELLMQMRNK